MSCSCKIARSRVPRSQTIREAWSLCPTHQAEEAAIHDTALADYRRTQIEQAQARDLREQFT